MNGCTMAEVDSGKGGRPCKSSITLGSLKNEECRPILKIMGTLSDIILHIELIICYRDIRGKRKYRGSSRERSRKGREA